MNNIPVKAIIDEDFNDYKIPAMFIAMPTCSFKCGKEYCQNASLLNHPTTVIDADEIIQRYLSNNLTKAIVFGGLDPMDTDFLVWSIVNKLRSNYKCMDDVVIYTGYTKEELLLNDERPNYYKKIVETGNIIFKFGRYIPGQQPHYDETLGVYLASDNQRGEKVS